MPTLNIDLETYSSIDIADAGVHKYTESPDFEILLFAYSVDGSPVEVVDLCSGGKVPQHIVALMHDPAVRLSAHNAAFERTAIRAYASVLGINAEAVCAPERWDCTMVRVGMMGYPMSLGAAAEAVGVTEQKLKSGTALINYFSKPCKPTKTNGYRRRNLPHHDPDKWAQFIEYCRQDVVTEIALREALKYYRIPEFEQKLWQLDQRINDRGLLVNSELVHNAIRIHDEYRDRLLTRMVEVTGLDNPNSLAQLKAWLSEETGKDITGLTKKDIPVLLKSLSCKVSDEPKKYHLHSGSGHGADTAWRDLGFSWGSTQQNCYLASESHYYYNKRTPRGNVEVPYEQYWEWMAAAHNANKVLNRKIEHRINDFAPYWAMVDKASAVFSIADSMFYQSGVPVGVNNGNAWAVIMAINCRKPVYVFDQQSEQWLFYRYINRRFEPCETPVLPTQFAGTGCRNIGETGLRAIRDVYQKTAERLAENDVDFVGEVLRARQELGKTSVKKFEAMAAGLCDDGRVRGLLQYYGAIRTGRWAGRRVQVQNLPQNKLHGRLLDLAREWTIQGNGEALELFFGNIPDVLSQLIRTAFEAPEGKVFGVSDFTSIEAVVLSWLAGEQWRLDVFKRKEDMYIASASKMFGIPAASIDKGSDLRQRGKVAELALGYQGGKNALITMGALDKGLTDAELQPIVDAWRTANPKIVQFWYNMNKAAIRCVKTGEKQYVRNDLYFMMYKGTLLMTLPSGRRLFYPQASIGRNQFDSDCVNFYGPNSTTGQWSKLSLYGGILVENAVQAMSRDLLAVAMQRLDAAGFPIVLHVHDEVVGEITADRMPELDAIMSQPVAWAPDLPLSAKGFITNYYLKD